MHSILKIIKRFRVLGDKPAIFWEGNYFSYNDLLAMIKIIME